MFFSHFTVSARVGAGRALERYDPRGGPRNPPHPRTPSPCPLSVAEPIKPFFLLAGLLFQPAPPAGYFPPPAVPARWLRKKIAKDGPILFSLGTRNEVDLRLTAGKTGPPSCSPRPIDGPQGPNMMSLAKGNEKPAGATFF